jgi:hypothetical protein
VNPPSPPQLYEIADEGLSMGARVREAERSVEAVVRKLVGSRVDGVGAPAVLVYPPLDCSAVTEMNSSDQQQQHTQ